MTDDQRHAVEAIRDIAWVLQEVKRGDPNVSLVDYLDFERMGNDLLRLAYVLRHELDPYRTESHA